MNKKNRNIDKDQIIALKKKGLSIKNIASEIGISVWYLNKIIKTVDIRTLKPLNKDEAQCETQF